MNFLIAGEGSTPAELKARTSNVYRRPCFRCLYVFGELHELKTGVTFFLCLLFFFLGCLTSPHWKPAIVPDAVKVAVMLCFFL